MSSSAPERLAHGRRRTRCVMVGDVAVGGDHPIRVQSMTTPPTRDTAATVAQIARLVEAGCEIVRLTVPTTIDADNLPHIRRELARRSIRVPLVADIHFTPAAALRAVEHVEKIRVNPGNYADKKRFAVREYSDVEYGAELERIEGVLRPLVLRARQLGVSMRIGTNHGSLSDRIMNRYGDTPLGMVESALEFVRICESHDYRELILSMKASNPLVVLQAYRLLVQRMDAEAMDYPIHLGVTEAGDGEDGRVKSAVGIGPLLDEGIGDTVRVSLTEDPVREIPVALALIRPYNERLAVGGAGGKPAVHGPVVDYARRRTREARVGPVAVGGTNPVRVEVPLGEGLQDPAAVRRELEEQAGVHVPEDTRAEIVSVAPGSSSEIEAVQRLRLAMELVAPRVALSARLPADWSRASEVQLGRWLRAAHRLHVPIDETGREALRRLLDLASAAGTAVLVEASSSTGDPVDAVEIAAEVAREAPPAAALLLSLRPEPGGSPLAAYRRLATRLGAGAPPLVLLDAPTRRGVDPTLGTAAFVGGLLCEGIGDAVHVAVAPAESRRLAFAALQASRVRITRTEFISCPSCGRTLFDLEETTARIKARTAHLKGVKIAVMGCVVNGPGEMADADFGYVGWGENKIALFVGRDIVAKDVPTSEADERLVELIKRHGRWVEPSTAGVAS